ncbi:MarR family EPS-associated transcriptional regulator [bacterium]|nr:MarR family EPS-associated transcriptional regulator [bacterium]
MNDIAKNNSEGRKTSVRDELRLKVLRALEANPELSQRQLAAELGVSLGGVNYALKALMERGFVKADNFRKSGNKIAYLYVLTPRGVAEKTSLATAFLGRKLEEYEVLRQEIEALQGEVGSGDSFGSGKGARS